MTISGDNYNAVTIDMAIACIINQKERYKVMNINQAFIV